jgi:hypothetical protein
MEIEQSCPGMLRCRFSRKILGMVELSLPVVHLEVGQYGGE